MKKLKLISRKNLPVNYPITFTALVYLFMDRFNAPGWLWGIVGTILAVLWLVAIWGNLISEEVDIFEDKE